MIYEQDGFRAHPVIVEAVSEKKVLLTCPCGWSRRCLNRTTRLAINSHWRLTLRTHAQRLALAQSYCMVCRRGRAMATGWINDHPVRYCRYARDGRCDAPGPFPPCEPDIVPVRVDRPEWQYQRMERPPFRPPEDQDDAIAWMVKWRDEGHACAAIARALDVGGFQPPMRGQRGGRWNGVTVKRYLAWHDGTRLEPWWR